MLAGGSRSQTSRHRPSAAPASPPTSSAVQTAEEEDPVKDAAGMLQVAGWSTSSEEDIVVRMGNLCLEIYVYRSHDRARVADYTSPSQRVTVILQVLQLSPASACLLREGQERALRVCRSLGSR